MLSQTPCLTEGLSSSCVHGKSTARESKTSLSNREMKMYGLSNKPSTIRLFSTGGVGAHRISKIRITSASIWFDFTSATKVCDQINPRSRSTVKYGGSHHIHCCGSPEYTTLVY